MLVLSRKIGEQVLIPELGISFTVLSVGTNRVQLGIKAPKEIQITRPDANSRTIKSRQRFHRIDALESAEKFYDRAVAANTI